MNKISRLFIFFCLLSFQLSGNDLDFFCLKTDAHVAPFVLDAEKFESRSDLKTKGPSSIDESPAELSLATKSKIKFDARFYDHGKKKVLVLGTSFLNGKEAMEHLVEEFCDEYDVIIFDYRWRDMGRFAATIKTVLKPYQRLIYDEVEEVCAVVDFLKRRKKYDEITGLGECYSSFIFTVAQAQEQKAGRSLFDKLILDSCWYSVSHFAWSVSRDPYLAINPQAGGTPKFLSKILDSQLLTNITSVLLKQVAPDASLKKWARLLKDIPILFIHGSSDKLVPLDSTFKKVWTNAKHVRKAALITPHGHVESSTKSKSVFVGVCKTFLRSACIEDFFKTMRSFGY